MRIGKLNLTWWRKRPSIHVADTPLDPTTLPWFIDHRKGLPPMLAAGMTFHEPDPERVAAQEPLPVWSYNLMEERRKVSQKVHVEALKRGYIKIECTLPS